MTILTKPQEKALKYVYDRQKGLPAGIVISKAIASRLVKRGVVEYAPPFMPMHLMKKPDRLSSVRCTTRGEILVENMKE